MAYYGSQGGGQRNGGQGNYRGGQGNGGYGNYRGGQGNGGYGNRQGGNDGNTLQWHEEKGSDNEFLTFINPYQFVPLDGTVKRKPIGEWRGPLTGRICCRLTLKTPFALPDHEHGKEDTNVSGHVIYPMMKLGGTPFIPGSTLRGMIRSVYEAATNSCMSILDNSPLHGRSPDIRKPGLLVYENEGWKLYLARSYLIKTYDPSNNSRNLYPVGMENGKRFLTGNDGEKLYQGANVNFRYESQGLEIVTWLGRGDKGSLDNGYLFISEKGIGSKHCYSHILVRDSNDAVELDPKTMSNLQAVLDCYRDEKINRTLGKDHQGYRDYDVSPKNGCVPVFYAKIQDGQKGDKYYLSPSMIGREAYHKEIRGLAGDNWSPCGGADHCCPACALFGMVGSRSAGSALRFTDAQPESPVPKDKIKRVCLKELSSPKISTTEFYTFRPQGARVWNYDYAVGNGNQKRVLRDDEPRLRGRKFYFHHPKLQAQDYTTKERTKRNCTVDILEEGSFLFDVYFEGVTKESLVSLLWALSPFSSENQTKPKPLCHKLGFGKPLGLGSVSIEVTDIETRTFQNGTYRINRQKPEDYKEALNKFEGDVPAELEKMLDFGFTGDAVVSYPLAKNTTANNNQEAGYQWFSGNKQMPSDPNVNFSGGRFKNPNVKYILPELSEDKKAENLQLPRLIKD